MLSLPVEIHGANETAFPLRAKLSVPPGWHPSGGFPAGELSGDESCAIAGAAPTDPTTRSPAAATQATFRRALVTIIPVLSSHSLWDRTRRPVPLAPRWQWPPSRLCRRRALTLPAG